MCCFTLDHVDLSFVSQEVVLYRLIESVLRATCKKNTESGRLSVVFALKYEESLSTLRVHVLCLSCEINVMTLLVSNIIDYEFLICKLKCHLR